MPPDRLSLRVELDAGDGAGPEERDEAARALREELLELDVVAVDRPASPAPAGARGVDATVLGTLLVTLGRSTLSTVAGTLQRWLSRGGVRTLTLELDGDRIELSNVSAADQRRLIETFVARHGGD